MVGFKSIWTLLILLLFAACVPQTKQTECKSNEAFNAALRTCVPVVNGPSSFINIDSYLPTSALTKYKNDTTPITLSVVISNPYAQTYTVTWERIFNGVPVSLVPSTPTSYSFAPSLLASEVGTHIISVKIKDANNDIVDTHSFEIKINDNPRPIIDTATVSPILYHTATTPNSTPINFQMTVKNNGSTMAGAGYRTDWTVTGGLSTVSETDTFPTSSPVGSLSSTGSNYPVLVFNPLTYGVGEFVVRARVTNTAAEVVAEQVWTVTVAHPPVAKVTSRNIYVGSSTPSFTTVTTAYNAVPYTSSPTYNFIPVGQTTQGDYCVTVSNGEGTYAGDGQFVRVDFYLDGASSLAYSGVTSAINPTVCLSQSSALASVMFTNASPSAIQAHTIVARVVDERTNQEYTGSDMNASLGTYPITWNVSVQPSNAAPTVGFTANSNLANITCGTPSATARTCSVVQDQTFTVGITATDDFYSTSSTTDTVQNKFTYTMILYRGGTPIQTCAKTVGDVTDGNAAGTDYVGPDYLCTFNVPSYDATGSVNPTAYAYNVAIVFSDIGSPISGSTGMSGTTLNYNLNVTEHNTAPVIDPQGPTTSDSYISVSTAPGIVISDSSVDTGAPGTYVTEGETLNINVLTSDFERDDFVVTVYRCTDGSACATSSQIATLPVTKADGNLTTMTTLSYAIPENLVPVTTPIGTNVDTFFKIEVVDVPDNTAIAMGTTTSTTTPVHFNVNVRNKNPAPQFGGTPNPVVAASITTMVGYPLTIDPGTVTDASIATTENVIAYQWYIDTTGNDDSYTPITGATSRILKWTPSNAIPTGTVVNLSLCISDNTVVNPQPAVGSIGSIIGAGPVANGSNCMGSWDVTVRPHALPLNFDNGTADIGNSIAVWQDTTVTNKRVIYSAYNDASGYIYVEKTVFDATGKIYNLATDGFRTIRFDAINGMAADVSTIKDISLAGTDKHLYIAYQAAYSGTPGSPKIRVRRIDKRSGMAVGTKNDPTYHDTGKFGFRYAQSLPTTTAAAVTVDAVSAGQSYTVNFNGALNAAETVTVNGVAFAANNGSTPLCSGGGASGCSDSGNASLLANAINNSTDRNLQGLTAVATGSQVTISGDVGGEYADNNINISNYVTGKLGKIVTYLNGSSAWEWHLPFVDLTTGSTINQIRVASAGAEANDYLSSVTINTSVVYSTIGTVNWFTNDLSVGNTMAIGSINSSSIAKIHVFPMNSGVASMSTTLFSSAPVAAGTLRLAAPVAGNNNYYAVAKVLVTSPSTYDWKVGRYDASLVPSIQSTFTVAAYNAASTAVLDQDHIADVQIQAFPSAGTSTEARLMVSSNNGTGSYAALTGDYDLFAVRFRSDNYLSCDSCVPLTYGTQELSVSKKIATSKIDRDMQIGSTAGTPVDRDVMFAAYGMDDNADLVYAPQVGIFNIEVETLSTTSTSSAGTEGFRPPLVGN